MFLLGSFLAVGGAGGLSGAHPAGIVGGRTEVSNGDKAASVFLYKEPFRQGFARLDLDGPAGKTGFMDKHPSPCGLSRFFLSLRPAGAPPFYKKYVVSLIDSESN